LSYLPSLELLHSIFVQVPPAITHFPAFCFQTKMEVSWGSVGGLRAKSGLIGQGQAGTAQPDRPEPQSRRGGPDQGGEAVEEAAPRSMTRFALMLTRFAGVLGAPASLFLDLAFSRRPRGPPRRASPLSGQSQSHAAATLPSVHRGESCGFPRVRTYPPVLSLPPRLALRTFSIVLF